ncbi:amidohydrolase family protein [Blastomonas sp.]|uniref:amidohydrolase family protein n=1 Tax=Blastomonas sp. TaxID=1909299 RepID=UPI0039190576
MTRPYELVLRQAQLLDGTVADIGIRDGRIAAIAATLGAGDDEIECQRQLLLPGLHDHHIHLLATAARMQSVDLSGITDADAIAISLREAAAGTGAGTWVRATGYDERAAGLPDRHRIDAWITDRPVRIQDRTGALWLLNSAALARIGDAPWPDAVETDGDGSPTGRIWRGDDWLRERIGSQPPSLAPLSRQLLRWGVTAVTDAGARNGPDEAALLSAAIGDGHLLQRLTMMGREDLPGGDGYRMGPVKLLFDERDLPDLATIAARIEAARALRRNVAAHCVTSAELLSFLAALDMAGGSQPGDRIEHGSVIPHCLLKDIARSGLTVVANPGFIARRGDRYLAEVDPLDLPDLQRLASLQAAGIPVMAGSDAPYGPTNPWVAIRAAIDRRTPAGQVLGLREGIDLAAALRLFYPPDGIAKGAVADCLLMQPDWQQRLRADQDPDPVAMTIMAAHVADPQPTGAHNA